jgi:hypothetical protein
MKSDPQKKKTEKKSVIKNLRIVCCWGVNPRGHHRARALRPRAVVIASRRQAAASAPSPPLYPQTNEPRHHPTSPKGGGAGATRPWGRRLRPTAAPPPGGLARIRSSSVREGRNPSFPRASAMAIYRKKTTNLGLTTAH